MAFRSSSMGSGEGSGEGGVWRRWWEKCSSCMDVICKRSRARRCYEKVSSSYDTGWRIGGIGVRHPSQRLGVPRRLLGLRPGGQGPSSVCARGPRRAVKGRTRACAGVRESRTRA